MQSEWKSKNDKFLQLDFIYFAYGCRKRFFIKVKRKISSLKNRLTDRYLTVVRVRKTRPKPPIFTHSVCVVVWFISIAMVSPILHYTQMQGNEGQFMCIQKFPSKKTKLLKDITPILENDDPAQVVPPPVTANPCPSSPDFGALPTGNLLMPGSNLPRDFPVVSFPQLSLYDFKSVGTIKSFSGQMLR